MAGDFGHDFVGFLPMELAVGVVEHESASDFKNLAGGRELFAPDLCQFGITLGRASMRTGLPGREAKNKGFDAAFVVKTKRAAKTAGFIVRMSGYAHEAKHGAIVTRTSECHAGKARST